MQILIYYSISFISFHQMSFIVSCSGADLIKLFGTVMTYSFCKLGRLANVKIYFDCYEMF